MSLRCAIGLMSGTSMDGIDIAVLETDGEHVVRRGPSGFFPYDAPFRQRIERALEIARTVEKRSDRPRDLASLEAEITKRHADAARSFLLEFRDVQPDIVGFHGQTVLHRPERGLTVQIGDGEQLASELGVPVVWDMRANDMLNGGQGAPLVPAYHVALAASLPDEFRKFPICFVNIGGISNVTFVADSGDPVAFDSGPGNSLIDQWVRAEGGVPYDADGAIASEGTACVDTVERYMASEFFSKPVPKSLDRSDFTLEDIGDLELADGARTLAQVSARSILAAAEHMPEQPKLWIVCGGGRKNPHIVTDLRAGAIQKGGAVVVAEDVGLDGDAMEAEAWAYLAVRAQRGMVLTFPTTTGCKCPVPGGTISHP